MPAAAAIATASAATSAKLSAAGFKLSRARTTEASTSSSTSARRARRNATSQGPDANEEEEEEEESDHEPELARNLKGGVLVKKHHLEPAWRFLNTVKVGGPKKEDQDPEAPELPAEIAVIRISRAMRAVQSSMTLREAKWILDVQSSRQESVGFNRVYAQVRENQEDTSFDPIAEAFKLISKDGSTDTYVQEKRMVQVFEAMGLTGVDAKIVQEVFDTLNDELGIRRDPGVKSRMDLHTFRRLCPLGREDEDPELNEPGLDGEGGRFSTMAAMATLGGLASVPGQAALSRLSGMRMRAST